MTRLREVIDLPSNASHGCEHCGKRATMLVWQDGVTEDGRSVMYYGGECGNCVQLPDDFRSMTPLEWAQAFFYGTVACVVFVAFAWGLALIGGK